MYAGADQSVLFDPLDSARSAARMKLRKLVCFRRLYLSPTLRLRERPLHPRILVDGAQEEIPLERVLSYVIKALSYPTEEIVSFGSSSSPDSLE